ncbi:ABC transporter substrate-binding protein [Tautonia rosea]|uniref:ABC transporter substrate-binding protein n=1 Tax=Tautonia rosea TaxID=2728037 RepID=UPI001F3C0FB0|nr:extracellular solute-binding protein [Tautonia rosea]
MGHRAGQGLAVVVVMVVGMIVSAGCGNRGGPEPGDLVEPFAGVSLRVAVLGEPALVGMLDDRRGEWERSRGGSVTIEAAPDLPAADGADVLVFPGDQLGALIDADRLRVLPDSLVTPPDRSADPDAPAPVEVGIGEQLAFAQVFDVYREEVSKYGDDRVALPLGGSALVLVYRVKAFQGEDLAAEAEAAGVSLDPPTTWEQLDALARFLHGRDGNGDGQPDAGIALAFAPDEVERLGVETFFARSAALGLHRDYFSLLFDPDSMAARLTDPPFVEALDALVALQEAGPDGVASFDAEAARSAFRSGSVALLIDRAERYASWLDEGDEAELGIARLPGSDRMFEAIRGAYDPADPPNRPGYLPGGGGWLVGVSSATAQADPAEDFARYLIEPDTASRLRVDLRVPMLPVRSPLVGQGPPLGRDLPGLSRRDWSDAVSRTFLADRVLVGLRIPGASGYLDDLAQAIASAATGDSPPAEALQSAADAWDARSRDLGLDRQKWHYRRSLNAFVTSDQPPPR